jgi:hypothetical protein
MRLRLFRRVRLSASRALASFGLGPNVDGQSAARAPTRLAAGYKGVGSRGSHRRTRGKPRLPGPGQVPAARGASGGASGRRASAGKVAAGGSSAGSVRAGGASAGSVAAGGASAGSGRAGGASAGSGRAGGASAGSGRAGGASAGSVRAGGASAGSVPPRGASAGGVGGAAPGGAGGAGAGGIPAGGAAAGGVSGRRAAGGNPSADGASGGDAAGDGTSAGGVPAGGAPRVSASPPSASAPGAVAGGTSRPVPPSAGSSGPGRGQPGPGRPQAVAAGGARAAVRTWPTARNSPTQVQRRAAAKPGERAPADARPWFEVRRSGHLSAGLRHCGSLEKILCRDWAKDAPPPAATITAIERLADLPQLIKEKLVAGLDAIYVGSGGVPDLDDMAELKGVALPSGRATWDACAGAYGDRKIIVGSRPSPTPDVMCHEIGHALDDIDGSGGCWQSDSTEFCRLYERCLPRMASEFHRQPGALGKREFFADSFAAIASGQRPALVHMLGGDTRAALDVMLYFNVRYGI